MNEWLPIHILPAISRDSHRNIRLHTGARVNVVLFTYLQQEKWCYCLDCECGSSDVSQEYKNVTCCVGYAWEVAKCWTIVGCYSNGVGDSKNRCLKIRKCRCYYSAYSCVGFICTKCALKASHVESRQMHLFKSVKCTKIVGDYRAWPETPCIVEAYTAPQTPSRILLCSRSACMVSLASPSGNSWIHHCMTLPRRPCLEIVIFPLLFHNNYCIVYMILFLQITIQYNYKKNNGLQISTFNNACGK